MMSKAKTIGLWVFKLVVAAAFIAPGIGKLLGPPMLIEEFDHIGLGQWFRYVTGLTEITGSALMLWPRTALVGALVLVCVAVGAFIAQVTILHQDWIHTVVYIAATGTLAWILKSRGAGR